eukprot:COSAG06_NODE_12906_length_1314_cov_0.922634_2_plen_28_part_01
MTMAMATATPPPELPLLTKPFPYRPRAE